MDPCRQAVEEHWRASELGDAGAEHAICADGASLAEPMPGRHLGGA